MKKDEGCEDCNTGKLDTVEGLVACFKHTVESILNSRDGSISVRINLSEMANKILDALIKMSCEEK